MKTKLRNIDGKEVKEIVLPKVFDAKIREDIVAKVVEAQKIKQPYAPSPIAGKQASARGKINRRRHVWKSGYGRGSSRAPRKTMSRRGSQFNWVGAGSPHTPGGFRAHPPKIISMMNDLKINKKEMKIAFASAVAATASGKELMRRYSRVDNEIKDVPFVVDSKIAELKVKQLLEAVKKVLGKELYEIAVKKKVVRAGKGKIRGRKYKSNAGMLLVTGKDEKVKTGAFDVVPADALSVSDLASGGLGRLTVYTEKAIKEMGEAKDK